MSKSPEPPQEHPAGKAVLQKPAIAKPVQMNADTQTKDAKDDINQDINHCIQEGDKTKDVFPRMIKKDLQLDDFVQSKSLEDSYTQESPFMDSNQ